MVDFAKLKEKMKRDEEHARDIEETMRSFSEGRRTLCVIAPEARKMFGYDLRCAGWRAFAKKCEEWIDENLGEGPVTCVSCLNLGAEQVFVLIALKMRDEGKDVKVVAAMPFQNQNARWPDDKPWRYILDHADASFVIEDRSYREMDIYNGQCWVAQHCDSSLCFAEDPEKLSFKPFWQGAAGVMAHANGRVFVDDWREASEEKTKERMKL